MKVRPRQYAWRAALLGIGRNGKSAEQAAARKKYDTESHSQSHGMSSLFATDVARSIAGPIPWTEGVVAGVISVATMLLLGRPARYYP
jgi:hypothetical protein